MDVCLENIMLQNAKFIEGTNGSIVISKDISIKLCDFGVAEIFNSSDNKNVSFKCNKQGLTIENNLYQAPEVFDEIDYDARKADMFQLGMIYYQCMVGHKLFEPEDIWFRQNAYIALMDDKLKVVNN